MRFIFRMIKRIISLVFIISIICGLMAAYAFFIEPSQLKSETISITSDKASEDFSVAVFADTHFGAGYTLEDFDKVVEDINRNDVDFVLFAGDLIDDFDNYNENTAYISQSLKKIEANFGKFAVFGNHDYGGGAENHYEEIMRHGGFTTLKNNSALFSKFNLQVVGVDDFLIGYGDIKTVNRLSNNTFNLILCHEPDIYDKFIKNNVDLMTSGHSHGGQVNIPYLKDKILPTLGNKYIKGKYLQGDSMLYVNPGVGTTKLNARLFSKPEVTYFNIKGNKSL